MAAAEVLRDLIRAGLDVSLTDDGRLAVSPRDRITDELRQSIRTHRDRLIGILAERSPRRSPSTPPGRTNTGSPI